MAETNFTLGPTSKTNKFPVLMFIICPELGVVAQKEIRKKFSDLLNRGGSEGGLVNH